MLSDSVMICQWAKLFTQLMRSRMTICSGVSNVVIVDRDNSSARGPNVWIKREKRPRRVAIGRYWRSLQDLPVQGTQVILRLRLGRWGCRNAGCERRIFTERLSKVCAPYAQQTMDWFIRRRSDFDPDYVGILSDDEEKTRWVNCREVELRDLWVYPRAPLKGD